MFTVKGLNVAYGRKPPVVSDVSFSLDAGFTILVGENGSGKTTLLRGLTSSLPSKMELTLDGKVLSNSELKERISYLPQEFDVYPSLKVHDLLQFVAIAKGIRKAQIEAEVKLAAEQVGIIAALQKRMKHCSTGTRRRVGIATALLGDPSVVILDEPTAGVDPKERIHFYKTIKQSFAGKTVLISTHILDDMDILADNVMMLSRGRISFHGSYHDYKHALDGKLYVLQTTGALTDAEKQFISSGRLLSTDESGNERSFKMVSEVPPGKDIPFCSKAEATLEDLWEYFNG